MDRINHYRKKYDEDDAFVRSVIDTHEDVVKIMFTKDLAHLQETHKPTGLALILQQISESRGEMEIWSVSRPANGNWFLVKGDYNSKQLSNMDLEKNEPEPKEKKQITKTEDDLKKKEEEAIRKLKNDEKDGIDDLPIKVKEKIKEKLKRGWTTEIPFETFESYYDKSGVNSVFNEKIDIYKLIPSEEFFNSLMRNTSRLRIKRGFCKSILNVKNDSDLTERQERIVKHLLVKCNNKYGKPSLKKYKQTNND
jgi:predicted DNA binding protein